jgi:hypothetical protein
MPTRMQPVRADARSQFATLPGDTMLLPEPAIDARSVCCSHSAVGWLALVLYCSDPPKKQWAGIPDAREVDEGASKKKKKKKAKKKPKPSAAAGEADEI